MSTRCAVPSWFVVAHVLFSAAYLIAVVETVLLSVSDASIPLIVSTASAALMALLCGVVNGRTWMKAREVCACVRHDDKGVGS